MNILRNLFNRFTFIKNQKKNLNSIRIYDVCKTLKLIFGSNAFFLAKNEVQIATGPKRDATPEEFDKIIKTACLCSENNIGDLIKCISNSIRVTCEEYRKCVVKQIQILNYGLKGDELDESRDAANKLKKEIEKYQSLIEYVEQLALNLALCSALMGNLDAQDVVCTEYGNLQKINLQQMSLNETCERVLLELAAKNVNL